MRKLLGYLLSMELAGVLIVVTAFSIGYATFIENDFGTIAAKALVYNALWFEIVIGIVFINLTYNSIKIQPWKTRQWSVFLFHISFLVIIIGAALTRYVGYEGMMSIREGATESTFLSEHTYLIVENEEGEQLAKKKVMFSGVSNDEVSLGFNLDNETYELSTFDFVPNATEYIDDRNGGAPLIQLMLRSNGKFQGYSLSKGQVVDLEGVDFGFGSDDVDVQLSVIDDQLYFNSNDTVVFFDMMSGVRQTLAPDSNHLVVLQKLYYLGDLKWVFNQYYPQARLLMASSENGKTGLNGIHFNITNQKGEVFVSDHVLGTSGYLNPKTLQLNDQTIKVSYGSEVIQLPFAIKLLDFQLERYPASNSPSSYASEVTLIDKEQGLEKDYRIFMNNVLDHRGYRFFQSSYDKDELGTVLSVNHDFWGMIVTYLGYALMFIAMFFALFAKNSRFKLLMRKTTAAALLAFLLIPSLSNAQSTSCLVEDIPQEQIDNLSQLLVQGHSGRFQPFNSVSSQVVRKFSRKITYNGLNADQILLGIMMNPDYWARQEMIKVSNDELKKLIGIDAPRAKFSDFFNSNGGGYKLAKYVDAAYQKKPALRGTFDKDVITVDERVNVFYMAINKEFMKIFPIPGKQTESWRTPSGPFTVYRGADSAFVSSVFDYYLQSLRAGIESGNYSDADLMLSGIGQFQEKYSPTQLADLDKMNMEITYNKINIFDRLFATYGLFGFVMLVLLFLTVLAPKYTFKWPVHAMAILILLSFVAHTLGLAARWYIAGHAPWSNGYEATVFIGWAVVLAGLVFYRNSSIALAATSVLASLIMYVAHLSWMNPEITNLVPVLKSYWLTIHVAIITASYGFLAMGAFMGFLNLIFMIFQTRSNSSRVFDTVKEITRINEMTIIVGLYMLTIGTFLGGIWANESWGRYWGWDPKETWAMVSILVYSFILHMRFIPGLKSVYSFNLMSLISFSSILMTFFGVNYYLSGLHSYAAGDPMPVPNFVYYTVVVIFIIGAWAYYKYRKLWN
jgi:cytochrome c-type biogenesis protein CcsB